MGYPSSIRRLRGRSVALTGAAWIARRELVARIRRNGGMITASASVNADTKILVRGKSSNWQTPDYGNKEEYLAELVSRGTGAVLIYDFEFKKLLEDGKPARTVDIVAGHRVEWLVPSAGSRDAPAARLPRKLDAHRRVKVRLEQNILRKHLLAGAAEGTCALCGRNYPETLLIAAHKKPRAYCTSRERRDLDNVAFMLCLFGCDALYECGYISVDDGGKVLAGVPGKFPAHLQQHMRTLRGRRCRGWDVGSDPYFEWHRTRRFLG